MESDAPAFKLPYRVLIGADSDVIPMFQIDRLPKLIIINKSGIITFVDKFASYEKIKEEIDKIINSKK